VALVARTYPDPLSTEEGGSVMLGIENRTPIGAREVLRPRVVSPTMEDFDAALERWGYERVSPWRREGDRCEADVALRLLRGEGAGNLLRPSGQRPVASLS